MPELPDITLYIESLQARIVDHRIESIRVGNPFILRTVDPPVQEAIGATVRNLHRIGKRIVLELDNDLFVVIHLMIAGRFHWKKPHAKLIGKVSHAAFDFPNGTLLLTEASTKKRASMHIVKGAGALTQFDRGGLEVLDADEKSFSRSLLRENRTLKRALTGPAIIQRYRECVLGRNSAPCQDLTAQAHETAFRRRGHAASRFHNHSSEAMD